MAVLFNERLRMTDPSSILRPRRETSKENLMCIHRLVAVLTIATVVSGCAHSSSGQSYPRNQTRTPYDVEDGEVVATRVVQVEGNSSHVGGWGGASVGRALGYTLGNGYQSWLLVALGSLGGTLAGEAIERKVTEEQGLEITVALDSNRTIAIVQARDVNFAVGERVRILYGPDGSARVSHP
jgi:outer membrane lipoprotein SlyB